MVNKIEYVIVVVVKEVVVLSNYTTVLVTSN